MMEQQIASESAEVQALRKEIMQRPYLVLGAGQVAVQHGMLGSNERNPYPQSEEQKTPEQEQAAPDEVVAADGTVLCRVGKKKFW